MVIARLLYHRPPDLLGIDKPRAHGGGLETALAPCGDIRNGSAAYVVHLNLLAHRFGNGAAVFRVAVISYLPSLRYQFS